MKQSSFKCKHQQAGYIITQALLFQLFASLRRSFCDVEDGCRRTIYRNNLKFYSNLSMIKQKVTSLYLTLIPVINVNLVFRRASFKIPSCASKIKPPSSDLRSHSLFEFSDRETGYHSASQ